MSLRQVCNREVTDMKILLIGLMLTICLAAMVGAAPGPEVAKPAPATAESVIGLADKYTGWCEPKLGEKDKAAVAEVKKTIADNKFSDVFLKKAADNLISTLTLRLAGAKSLDGLTVSSAFLVKEFPKNRRAINLFASTLSIYGKDRDAIVVFQYLLSLDPKNVLTRLNLANCYLDTNEDEKAKAILDKLELEDSDNKAVFRALATYYYRKNNAAKFREYLFKAATFKGFKRKKAEAKREQVDQNEVKGGESTGEMETRLKQLETVEPMTTADILEQDFPDAARQIREKYGKLQTGETWILPKLPMVNLNGPEEFSKNEPIVEAWVESTMNRLKVFPRRMAQSMGIDPDADDAVRSAQAEAAAKKQMNEAMQQAQDAIKYMENMPGIPKAQIDKAKRELEKLVRENNLKVEDKPVDKDAPPPGSDSGSIFAYENYYNHMQISNAYLKYFMKYYQEYNAKFADICKVYGQRVEAENRRWQDESASLARQHQEAVEAGNNHFHEGPGGIDQVCLQAAINHKKQLNEIALSHYHQWSNLYMPQYAQKMKPNLDAYWKVCMLHIRNMQDPKVMEREYNKVAGTYALHAGMAIAGIGGGGAFDYIPAVEEEQRELDEAIARAKEEAESKKPEFEKSYQSPEFSFTEWINDHFVLEVSGEFLALKITAHSIEFEAYVPGVGAGAKYDFDEEKFETYTGFGGKLEVGVNICGLGAKAEAKGDFYRRTATWDLKNGTYTETDSAKGEAKGSLGPLSAGGEFEVDAQLTAKVTTKVSFADTLTIQDEQTLN